VPAEPEAAEHGARATEAACPRAQSACRRQTPPGGLGRSGRGRSGLGRSGPLRGEERGPVLGNKYIVAPTILILVVDNRSAVVAPATAARAAANVVVVVVVAVVVVVVAGAGAGGEGENGVLRGDGGARGEPRRRRRLLLCQQARLRRASTRY